VDVSGPGAIQAHNFEARVAERGGVREQSAATGEAGLPLTQVNKSLRRVQERATGPPQIILHLEDHGSAIACFDRRTELAGYDISLRRTGIDETFEVLASGRRRDRRSLATVLDSQCRRAARQTVQKPDPRVPGGAATRVIGLFHDSTNVFEDCDVFGLLAERELDLGLLYHGIDTAQAIGLCVRHRLEAVQRILKVRQRLAVCPTTLRFLGGKDGVIDRFFDLVAATKVQRQEFCDFVAATLIELFEGMSDGAVVGPAMPLEHAAIGCFLGQRVAKDKKGPVGLNAFVEEFETAQLVQLIFERPELFHTAFNRRSENSRPITAAVCRSRLVSSGNRSMRAITTLWIVSGTIRSERRSLASPTCNANCSRKSGLPSALATIS
jgi:hypothetical protein